MRAHPFIASLLVVTSALVASAPGTASAGPFGFGRQKGPLTGEKIDAEWKASGGWAGARSYVAKPNTGSLPLGGGWRLFVGLRIDTQRIGGSDKTGTRTFGIGKGGSISPKFGNVVFKKGLAVQTWHSAPYYERGLTEVMASTGQFRGTTVTAGSKTRARVRDLTPAPTLAEALQAFQDLYNRKSPEARKVMLRTNQPNGGE